LAASALNPDSDKARSEAGLGFQERAEVNLEPQLA
jgi:hypothetical protein